MPDNTCTEIKIMQYLLQSFTKLYDKFVIIQAWKSPQEVAL